MTSLVLFDSNRPKSDQLKKRGLDWGTGKPRDEVNRPRSPRATGTFLHSGYPETPNYRITDITLSNVRMNDELVPAPLHTTNMSLHEIPLEFPSNHPYTSHISEKAVFPVPGIDINDRPSTCSDPYIVTHKTRGNPFRREVHYHGLQPERHHSLKWPDKHYMQVPRSLSDARMSSIYPWPRKTLAPNGVENKQINHQEVAETGDRSSNDGPESDVVFDQTSALSPNEQLNSHFYGAFNSTGSIEEMQTVHSQEKYRQPITLERQQTSIYHAPMETIKVMSENEKLDDQLRYGTDYVNLPSHRFPTDVAPTWSVRPATPDENEAPPREIRFLPQVRPKTTGSQIARDHYASHQQMDAQNRLQQLEVIRPKENINLLNAKYRLLQHPRHHRPIVPQYRDDYVNTLYDQMGAYVQERAGIYHTDSYDPSELPQAIPELYNNGQNDHYTNEEEYLNELSNAGEQIQGRSKPKLFQYRAIGDYQTMRDRLLDKLRLPRDAGTVDSRTQEGQQQLIQRETVYGQSYNTRKFLQENTLVPHARVDPTSLMSTNYNHNLERVRCMTSLPRTSATVSNGHQSNQKMLTSPLMYPEQQDEVYSSKYITEHTDGYYRRPTVRVYDSPFKGEHDQPILKSTQQTAHPPARSSSFDSNLSIPTSIPKEAKVVMHLAHPDIIARYIEPQVETKTTYQRSFKDIAYHEAMPAVSRSLPERSQSMRDVYSYGGQVPERFTSQPKLRDIQDRWSKTKAQSDYHLAYPEPVPDVGDCTIRAKKEILVADTLAKRGLTTVR